MFCKEKKKKNIQQIYNVVNTLKFTQQIYMNSCNISVSRVQKKICSIPFNYQSNVYYSCYEVPCH